MTHSIQAILTQDNIELGKSLQLDANSARMEVQCLLQHILRVSRSYLLAYPERLLSETEFSAYRTALQRRLEGEPIAYILGVREFYGLDFKVTPATLIPRPETELLVELALARISPLPLAGEGLGERVLDMGTGSGAIALTIAHQLPAAEVWASDKSAAALAVARDNAQLHHISNVHFIQSDWFAELAGQRFNLIVSNPPYIAAADRHLVRGDLRFEPRLALASGNDGLEDIRRIIQQASEHLAAPGWLLLEHGYDQAPAVRELLQAASFIEVFSARDLAGIERCSGGRLPL